MLSRKGRIPFAAEGRVKSEIRKAPLDDISDVFERLKDGSIESRMVRDFAASV